MATTTVRFQCTDTEAPRENQLSTAILKTGSSGWLKTGSAVSFIITGT